MVCRTAAPALALGIQLWRQQRERDIFPAEAGQNGLISLFPTHRNGKKTIVVGKEDQCLENKTRTGRSLCLAIAAGKQKRRSALRNKNQPLENITNLLEKKNKIDVWKKKINVLEKTKPNVWKRKSAFGKKTIDVWKKKINVWTQSYPDRRR